MESGKGAALCAEGRELYRRLLDEANQLLKLGDSLGPEALERALGRRQEIVELLQNFDARLEAAGAGAEALLEFRAFREEATWKILEVDGLVIALARNTQEAIKEKLAGMVRSKSASRAYDSRGSRGPGCVSESV